MANVQSMWRDLRVMNSFVQIAKGVGVDVNEEQINNDLMNGGQMAKSIFREVMLKIHPDRHLGEDVGRWESLTKEWNNVWEKMKSKYKISYFNFKIFKISKKINFKGPVFKELCAANF